MGHSSVFLRSNKAIMNLLMTRRTPCSLLHALGGASGKARATRTFLSFLNSLSQHIAHVTELREVEKGTAVPLADRGGS
jgi:hypothetical protein